MGLDQRIAKRRAAAVVGAIVVVLLGAAIAAWAGALAGPVIQTNADVSCPSGSATTALAASTPVPGTSAGVTNRLSAQFDWVSGSPARVGDVVSASQGIPIAAATGVAGARATIPGDAAISCWGIGGTSVLAPTTFNRQ